MIAEVIYVESGLNRTTPTVFPSVDFVEQKQQKS